MPEKTTILSWSKEDRPREKLLLKGEKALSNSELLAILIGSGTRKESAVDVCRKILGFYGNDLDKLSQLGVAELTQFNGIGSAKAISIIAAMELARRKKAQVIRKTKISGSEDVFAYMETELLDLDHEQFWVILLSRSNVVLGRKRISSGGVSGTVVDQKIIFKHAINELASGLILVHNHPSGNPQPSRSDQEITSKMSEACGIMEIPLIDHMIFTNNAYFSFADSGML